QRRDALFVANAVDGFAIPRPAIRPYALHPRGYGMFGFGSRKLRMLSGFQVIEINLPPTTGVTDVCQRFAIRRKLWLKDGRVGIPGNRLYRFDVGKTSAVISKLCQS